MEPIIWDEIEESCVGRRTNVLRIITRTDERALHWSDLSPSWLETWRKLSAKVISLPKMTTWSGMLIIQHTGFANKFTTGLKSGRLTTRRLMTSQSISNKRSFRIPGKPMVQQVCKSLWLYVNRESWCNVRQTWKRGSDSEIKLTGSHWRNLWLHAYKY